MFKCFEVQLALSRAEGDWHDDKAHGHGRCSERKALLFRLNSVIRCKVGLLQKASENSETPRFVF